MEGVPGRRRCLRRRKRRVSYIMSMEHKAFEFDWLPFERDLHHLIVDALSTRETRGVEAFVDENLTDLVDPYEGQPIAADWRNGLVNRDTHEVADYALTRYYDPVQDYGIGSAWIGISDAIDEQVVNALLGQPIGPSHNRFDPGRFGSSFQSPERVTESLVLLNSSSVAEMRPLVELFTRCARLGKGVYVTF